MKLKYILLSKRSQSKRLHTIGSQSYDMLKKAKKQTKQEVSGCQKFRGRGNSNE